MTITRNRVLLENIQENVGKMEADFVVLLSYVTELRSALEQAYSESPHADYCKRGDECACWKKAAEKALDIDNLFKDI